MRRVTLCLLLLWLAPSCGGGQAGAAGAKSPGDVDQAERDLAAAEDTFLREMGAAGPGRFAQPAQSYPMAQSAPQAEAEAEAPAAEAPPEAVADKAAADEAPAEPAPAVQEAAGGDAEARSAPPDRCSVACRAYQSMRRSADRICDITGADDERCGRARRRIESARSQIEHSPCRC